VQTAALDDLEALRVPGGDWSLPAPEDDPFRWPGSTAFQRTPPFVIPAHPGATQYRFVFESNHFEPVERITEPRPDIPADLWATVPVNLDDRRPTVLTVTALSADGSEQAEVLRRRCNRRPPPAHLDGGTVSPAQLRERAQALAAHTAELGTMRHISDPVLMTGRPPSHGKMHLSDSYAGQGLLAPLRALYEGSDDEVEQAAIRARARLGAAYLAATTGGRLDVTNVHWVQFFTTAWAGFAWLDAYAITGDPRWRERALRQARMYRDMQLPSGAWTWTNRNGGRYPDCGSYFAKKAMFTELGTGEFLRFLTRVRRELDTDEFLDVEQAAVAWERREHLHDLRLRYHHYVQSSLVRASSPLTAFHLCLAALETADSGHPLLTDAETALLARYLEDQWVTWRRTGEDGGILPSRTACGTSRYTLHMTVSQVQMAEICLRLGRRLDDPVWRAKGLTLLNDVLRTQDEQGDIHPLFGHIRGGEPLTEFTRAGVVEGLRAIADLMDEEP
jgi:hypothetical protein